MRQRHLRWAMAITMLGFAPACVEEGEPNEAPVADAGPDQRVTTGSLVTLDGTASSDADGDPLLYRWRLVDLPDGSDATLSDASEPRPTLTVDVEGAYAFELVVNDGTDDSAVDDVVITAATSNSAPVADAGPDQNVTTGDLVTLDGSASSDADGDPLTHAWRFVSQPTGSTAVLSDSTDPDPTFTPGQDGDYIVELVVDDGAAESAADTVSITASTMNSAPVADAGPDQMVDVGSQVTLDGSGSSDADGDPLTWAWSLTSWPAGSTAILADATTASPTFTPDLAGDYVLSLTVDDGLAASTVDTVTVSADFFVPPSTDYVAVNFTIDDTANPTFTDADGLAWKGSFSFDPDTRIMTFNGSWSGPYVMVHDDGPWSAGGHEPAGSTAGDNLWGVTVWVSNAASEVFEYGAISGSVDGSDGTWIWIGSNGSFSVTGEATTPIDAPGLVLP